MKRSVMSWLRVGFPALVGLISLDSVALAGDTYGHAATQAVAGPASKQFEIRFLEGMIDHHAMAVHMSQLLKAQAVHPELRALGDSIVAGQSAEIVQMQAWLKEWYGRAHEPSTKMAGMGMVEKMKGEAFEKKYLQMMIRHHTSAVRSGKECERRAKHAELHTLCHHITDSQQREIAIMKDWLCRWYKQCN